VARQAIAQVTTGVRVAAIAAAAFWALLFYGLVDLLIDFSVADQALRDDVYLLAIGWGLLFSVLVPGAFVLFAALSGPRVFLHQLLVTAAAILLCGGLSLELGTLMPSLFLLGMTAGLAAAAGIDLRVTDWRFLRRGDWTLMALALLAVVAGITYAAQMIHAVGYSPDDVTWGLKHLPMQAAFGVAIASCAAISTLAGAAEELGWRAASFPAGLSAAGFGVASVLHPDQTGSWGFIGGWAAVAWGVAFVACSATRRRSRP
jgi:hypothetical protein